MASYQLTTETRGPAAFWTITPERPIWGSQRFVLRSSRPLGDDREIVHPEISPLGRGAVDAYLSVVNATGRPPTIENSAGLEKIPYASRFQAREFAGGAGIPVSAFRVVQESWGLRVQSPRNVAEASDSQDGSARVAFGDMMVVALPDRSSIGRAVYETVPVSGSHLVVRASRRQLASLGDRRLEPGQSAPLVLGDMVDRSRRPPAVPRQLDLEDRSRRIRVVGFDLARGSSQGGEGAGDDSGRRLHAPSGHGPGWISQVSSPPQWLESRWLAPTG